MSHQNLPVLLLDGRFRGEEDPSLALKALTEVLDQNGARVQLYTLSEMRLAHCIGCFDCWLKTPGVCVYGEARACEMLRSFVQSDTLVLFTPVVFGGYSSVLKQMVDRFISLILPYFDSYHGEMHHRRRYTRYPRLVVVGVQRDQNAEEARLFKLLAGRNAINYYSPSYAVEVVTTHDGPDRLRQTFSSLLTRNDRFPDAESVTSLPTAADPATLLPGRDSPRRACLIVGSPKTKSPSTSAALGGRLLDRLGEGGWETESVALGASLQMEQGQRALLTATDRADLLLLAFPLYVDALPFLATKALELIANHRRNGVHKRPVGLVAVANNGFIESYHNNVVLSICRRFGDESGMTWMGSLAMGAGEGICGGELLEPKSAMGIPTKHVVHALDTAGDALARGLPVPKESAKEISRNPIPYVPFPVWRTLFLRHAGRMWEERAAKNGVDRHSMFAQPYAIATDERRGG